MTMLDDAPVGELDRPSPWSAAALSPAAEVGRWRLAGRLARREIRRRPWRTLLVVLLIGVPVAGLTVGEAAYRSSQLPQDQSHRLGAADARLVTSPDQAAHVRASLPTGVESLWGSEVSWLPVRIADHPSLVVNTDVSTMDLAAPLARGIARPTAGRLPSAPDEVFLSDSLAHDLGVGVGDEIELVRPSQQFEVVGVGQANGYGRLLDAPGFDLSVLRPDVVQSVALVRGEVVRDHRLPQLVDDSPEAWINLEYPDQPVTDQLVVFLSWIFCIMLMAVLGIVIAAAFAVSGRRQIVTIGQLSAAGTDPAVLRRYLSLQGTWSGAVGVLVGLATGLALVPALRGVIANDGRIAIEPADLVAIALIALVTATLAAIVPTRDLARSSVLAALGGRRPLGKVRPRQVQIGVVLVGAGLLALWIAVGAARVANDDGGGMEPDVILAGAGGLAVLAGMCCVCPLFVDLIARLGSKRTGAIRVATRGLSRHRARSAALLAAVAAIGAAAMAAGATAEQDLAVRRANAWWEGSDVIEIGRNAGQPDSSGSMPTLVVDQEVLSSVDAIVGPMQWVRTRQVVLGDAVTTTAMVADTALIDLLGLDAAQRAALAAADGAVVDPGGRSGWQTPGALDQSFGRLHMVALDAASDTRRVWTIVNPTAVDRLHLVTQPGTAVARRAGGVTHDQYSALMRMNVFVNEGQYFSAVPAPDTSTYISVNMAPESYDAQTRLVILGGMLLLTTVVVAIGMALSAAEGRDERDALVTLGAAPGVLARVVGIKAWMLACAGGLLAVPLGFGTLRLVVVAAREQTRFPWLIAGGVVIVVPVLVGVGATVLSAIAQRARPVRISTMSPD